MSMFFGSRLFEAESSGNNEGTEAGLIYNIISAAEIEITAGAIEEVSE